MRLQILAAAAACTLLLSMPHAPAEAAETKSKKSGSARTADVKSSASSSKGNRTGKSASTRTASGKSKSKSSAKAKGMRTAALAAALPVPAAVTEAPLTSAQLDIARLVQTGLVHCEMGQSVSIEPQVHRAGAFHVRFGGAVYNMVPEETSTGAVRLSDPRAGVVWLQIPVKSMLMDTRQGQRMVDACTTPFQRSAQAMATARSASATEAADGLGIAPAPLVPLAGFASAMPVAPAALPAGSLVVPVSVTHPVAILPGTSVTPAADPSAAVDPGIPRVNPAQASNSGTPGGSAGAGGTNGTNLAVDANLPPARPGATSDAAPPPAWASEAAPAALTLPSRPQ